MVIANEPGSLGSLTTVIGKNGGNITNLKITNRSTDFFEMLVDVEVADVKHLTNIIAALRATPGRSTPSSGRAGDDADADAPSVQLTPRHGKAWPGHPRVSSGETVLRQANSWIAKAKPSAHDGVVARGAKSQGRRAA